MKGLFRAYCVCTLLIATIVSLPAISHAETDITNKIQLNKSRLGYNRATGTSYLDVSITNISEDVILTPIKVVIDSISSSVVTVANADGVTSDGKPYFEYSSTLEMFSPNEVSDNKRWIFNNPTRARFSYDFKIMGNILEAVQEVGPDGGNIFATLQDETEVLVEIPEGALSDSINISICYKDDGFDETDFKSLIPLIDLGPDGTTFNQPINITFNIPQQNIQNAGFNSLEEGREFLRFYYFNENQQSWETLKIIEINNETNSITIQMKHFTGITGGFVGYYIENLHLYSPVKKDYNLNFFVTIIINPNRSRLIPMNIEAWFNSQIAYKVISCPQDSNTTTVTFNNDDGLRAPNDEGFQHLNIFKVIISKSKPHLIPLWSQEMVVDYDPPSIDKDSLAELIDEYKPILEFAENERYYPTTIYEVFDREELNATLTFPDKSTATNIMPEHLGIYSSKEHELSYMSRICEDGEYPGDDNCITAATNELMEKVVYATAVEDSEHLYLMYIFFYIYDPKIPSNDRAAHQSDQERIIVILNKDSGYYTPHSVVYGQHLGYKEGLFETIKYLNDGQEWNNGHVIVPWENVAREGFHPYVFVAQGSHACYPRPGYYEAKYPYLPNLKEMAGGGDSWGYQDYDLDILPRLSEITSSSEYSFLLFSGKFGEYTNKISPELLTDIPLMSHLEWWLFLEKPDDFLNFDDNTLYFNIHPKWYEKIHYSTVSDPVPIILVHGNRSEEQYNARWDFEDDNQYSLKKYIDDNDQDFSQFDVYIWYHDTSKPIGFNGYTGNAAELAEFMNYEILPKYEPGTKAILLAHSRGGLVCRSYMNYDYDYDGELEGENIIGLITLGTPHHGSPLAVPDWAAFFFDNLFLSPHIFNRMYNSYKHFDPYRLGDINLAWDNMDEVLSSQSPGIEYNADISSEGSMYFSERDMNKKSLYQFSDDTVFYKDEWSSIDYKSIYGTLFELNEKEKYKDKIITFAAYDDFVFGFEMYTPDDITSAILGNDHERLKLCTDLLAIFDTLDVTRQGISFCANDGLVPLQSALFLDISDASSFSQLDLNYDGTSLHNVTLNVSQILEHQNGIRGLHYDNYSGILTDHLDLLDTPCQDYWDDIKNLIIDLGIEGRQDSDGDGFPDDQDAFPNDPSEWLDTDDDGIGNNADTDDDNDGMPDIWEDLYDCPDSLISDAGDDCDGDGFTNIAEYEGGSDPTDSISIPEGADLNTGLIAYYPFEGNANDATGNGNNQTGCSVSYTNGIAGQAAYFNGISDYIRVADAYQLDGQSNMTVAFWIRPAEDMNSSTGRQDLLYKRCSSSTSASWAINYDDIDGQLQGITVNPYWIPGGPDYDCAKVYHATSFSAGGWYHIAMTYDSTDTIHLYVNGNESGTLIMDTMNNSPIIDSIDDLYIGMRPDVKYYYHGAMDDLRIYNRTLNEFEIQELCDLENELDKDLVAFYPFNGSANDESGFGNHGSIYEAMLAEDRFGNPSGAYSFDGIDDYIVVPHDSSYSPTDQITVWALFKTSNLNQQYKALLSKKQGGGYSFHFNRPDGQFMGQLAFPGDDQELYFPMSKLSQDKWHSVAITWDGTSVKLYLDGNEEDSSTPTGGDFYHNDGCLFMGTELEGYCSPTPSQCGEFILDEVRIYSRALTPYEILRLTVE